MTEVKIFAIYSQFLGEFTANLQSFICAIGTNWLSIFAYV